MQARKDLQGYLDRDAMLAQALGISVEELDAARAEGKTLRDLIADSELDAETLREKLQEAHEAAIAQAVEDGVITQEQADDMADGMGRGHKFGGPMRPDSEGGFRGRGGFKGQVPGDSDTNGPTFRRSGRFAPEADSAL
jgi:hypothetical protein